MPVEDEEISAFVRKQFEKRGITIHTGASVSAVTVGDDAVQVNVQTSDGVESLTVDRVLVAAGITGNVEDLGFGGSGRRDRARCDRHRPVVPYQRFRDLCDR